jgi:PadR family transcriptional regulator, regulatory protein AphA
MQNGRLSPTAYVVLGMLRLGARTGYDIKSVVDQSTRFFWAASYGQIYPELRQLEKAGLVTGKLAPTGGRQRKEYELTKAGQDALAEWAAAPPQMPELRDESLLKLFFGDALPREEALEQLRMRRAGHEQFLAILKEIEGRPGQDPTFVNLVLQYGIDYAEFNIDWCKRQERRLKEKEAA